LSAVRELPLVHVQPARSLEWLRAAKRTRQLSWVSLVWMGAEGTIGVFTGVLAGSIALTAFGLQSFIEGLASLVIVWLFSGTRLSSNRAEGRRAEVRRDPVLPARPLRRLRSDREADHR